MTMWEDLKRYLAVFFSHLMEQKEIFLHKLILVNYGDSRRDSYSRIGERFFLAYKEGRIAETPDEQIEAELDTLFRVEEEMEKARAELEGIRAKYAAQRKAVMGESYATWRRARESFVAARPPAPARGGAGSSGGSDAPPAQKPAGE